MNRHLSRTIVMQSLYEWDFRRELNIKEIATRNISQFDAITDKEYIVKTSAGIVENLDKIDQYIQNSAPDWPLDQVAIIDKTILRVATYELLMDRDVPVKVVINEAVELAKSFGSDNSGKFVNGVLGSLYRNSDIPKESEVEEILQNNDAENSVDEDQAPKVAHIMPDDDVKE